MVALAILGVAIVAVFQLFSLALRSTKKAADYTMALSYAKSMLDEAYSIPDPENGAEPYRLEGNFNGTRQISLKSESEDGKIKLYEIIVTVTWPPSGRLSIKGLRTFYVTEE